MDKKIAVLGAGAIGSSVGADVTQAGYDVVLIDQWPAHVEAMKTNGLRIILPEEELHTPVRAYHLCEVCTLNTQFDIVLLTSKSYDSCWLAQFIKPYLKPDGVLVPVQNSLNDEWVAPIIGAERDVGCVVELSAEVFIPGIVQRNTSHQKAWFGLGELTGEITPRLQELESIMKNVGRVSLTPNIMSAKWTKLISSSMLLGPLGVLGLKLWEATEVPGVLELLIRCGTEAMTVAKALGFSIEPIFGLGPADFAGSTEDVVRKLAGTIVLHGKAGTKVRGVSLQDYLKDRHTETECLNGLIVSKGKQVNVPTPANAAIVEVDREICSGARKPDRSNLARVQQLLAAQS